MIPTGQNLLRYPLLALLGEGGLGAVYRAHDVRLACDVAVKVMHARYGRRPR